jgi:DNA repair exonuclease SbcCD ATPase subunit
MTSALHSIAFPKNYKLDDMISFLEHNHIKPIKPIDVYQPNYNRVRIRDPKLFDHFTTKILNNGIHLIIGWYKKMKGGAKKIYFGAQRDLKKTERRPTQTEAWQAHQIRYWGLHEISEKIKQMGIPPPKKFLKEIEKYKNMVINNPEKLDKYYKFMDDKETTLKLEKERIQNEEERLMKEAEKIKEDEKILKNNAATKLQSLVRMKKAKKELEALKKAKKEKEEYKTNDDELIKKLNDIDDNYYKNIENYKKEKKLLEDKIIQNQNWGNTNQIKSNNIQSRLDTVNKDIEKIKDTKVYKNTEGEAYQNQLKRLKPLEEKKKQLQEEIKPYLQKVEKERLFIEEINENIDRNRRNFFAKNKLFTNLTFSKANELRNRIGSFDVCNLAFKSTSLISEKQDREIKDKNDKIKRNLNHLIKNSILELKSIKDKEYKTKEANRKKEAKIEELDDTIQKATEKLKNISDQELKNYKLQQDYSSKEFNRKKPLRELCDKRDLIYFILGELLNKNNDIELDEIEKPDLSKAATKIQSLFRMRKAKKELEALKKAKEEKNKKKDVTLETLTDKAKSIIYNAIYLVPYEYRKKYEELIPRIKLSKGYEYPRYNENMYKSPDELVPIMDEIYNENDLIANIKNLLYR